ncbi:MAG TPA: phytanoyl-CoA dioxygenase family protein [Abditibacteriaceae bacterium]|jgi:ectoine hydroxylase-related dioxygenase (phytanoyl-CoA dioxygenase family)
MVFSEEQKKQFQEEGWLAVENFWDETEIAAMRAELQRLQDVGLLRNVATEGDGKTTAQNKANLQLCPMAPHSRFFRAMPFAPKALEAVRSLLGDPVLLHLDQVFVKPARHGAGTNWHQDNAYFRISDPLMGTALWTAVHDANEANGTIRVIPRRFREELKHTRDGDSDHHIRCYPDESEAVSVELPAGGVVFFCYGTPHATGANNTDADRAGVALHFLRTDFAQPELVEEGRDYRPLLSGPGASGGEAEYGERVAGTWEAEVQHALGAVAA